MRSLPSATSKRIALQLVRTSDGRSSRRNRDGWLAGLGAAARGQEDADHQGSSAGSDSHLHPSGREPIPMLLAAWPQNGGGGAGHLGGVHHGHGGLPNLVTVTGAHMHVEAALLAIGHPAGGRCFALTVTTHGLGSPSAGECSARALQGEPEDHFRALYGAIV